MQNSIHNIATQWCESDSGALPWIVMGLNIVDVSTVDAFLNLAFEQFKNQRMCSPVETAHMTVTIAGEMTAEDFRTRWIHRCASDPILKYFTSLMVHADVLHIRGRELLGKASLVSREFEEGV
jgi:hypothetical protein